MSNSASSQLFAQAVQQQQQGLHDLALQTCQKILRRDPRFTDALLMQGIIRAQRQEFDQAARHFEAITRINPNHLGAHYNLGLMRQNVGLSEQAAIAFETVLTKNPRHVGSLNALGVLHASQGSVQQAMGFFVASLRVDARQPETLNNLGNCLFEQGQWQAALEHYQEAVRIAPQYGDALFNLAKLQRRLGLPAEAMATYQHLLEQFPSFHEARINWSKLFLDAHQPEAALACLNQRTPEAVNHPEMWFAIGVAHEALGDPEQANGAYSRAIALDPTHHGALVNRANALISLRCYAQARSDLTKALESKDDVIRSSAWTAWAELFQHEGSPEQVDSAFDQAIGLNPDNPKPRFNQGLWHLLHMRWNAGWTNYPQRHQLDDQQSTQWLDQVPIWSGPPPAGRVLLVAEQGIGDEVFLTKGLGRYIALYGSPACVTVDRRLLPVFERSYPALRFFDRARLTELDFRDFDVQLALGDLGTLLMLNPAQMPELTVAHLKPAPTKTGLLSSLGGSSKRPRIGLSWKSKNAKLGADKSMALMEMMRELGDLAADWINLQYGQVSDEIAQVQIELGIKIHQVQEVDLTQDLEGLMGLIQDCDAVVTTSNSTAHLCGALGKPGVVLVPFGKSKLWYWHLHDGPSIWYPSLQVLHAQRHDDWHALLQLAHDRLRATLF